MRLNWCLSENGGEKEISDACQKNFCTFCCEKKIPSNMESDRKKCEK